MIFRRDSLVDPSRPKAFKDLTAADMARMEQEMSLVQSRFKAIELSYGTDVLNLVLTRGYVSKLLNNSAVTKYLERHQPEFLEEFRAIVAATVTARCGRGGQGRIGAEDRSTDHELRRLSAYAKNRMAPLWSTEIPCSLPKIPCYCSKNSLFRCIGNFSASR
jgi:hypothetical protein